MTIIDKRKKVTKFFDQIENGSTFLDLEGDLCIKRADGGFVRLKDGAGFLNYSNNPSPLYTVVNAEIHIVD